MYAMRVTPVPGSASQTCARSCMYVQNAVKKSSTCARKRKPSRCDSRPSFVRSLCCSPASSPPRIIPSALSSMRLGGYESFDYFSVTSIAIPLSRRKMLFSSGSCNDGDEEGWRSVGGGKGQRAGCAPGPRPARVEGSWWAAYRSLVAGVRAEKGFLCHD